MDRVLIIGNCGSGKSTLSRYLGALTNLPVVHLDNLFWLSGWKESSHEEFDKKLDAVLAQDRWVMDGNYNRTLIQRIERADSIIFLDFNRFVCVWRIIRRALISKGEQAEGCPNKVDFEFFKYVI